jgi:hypothetical protein
VASSSVSEGLRIEKAVYCIHLAQIAGKSSETRHSNHGQQPARAASAHLRASLTINQGGEESIVLTSLRVYLSHESIRQPVTILESPYRYCGIPSELPSSPYGHWLTPKILSRRLHLTNMC